MGTLTKEAREARAQYLREYRANMTEEQKQKRREYEKKWRKENPDKVKAIQARYWEKKAQQDKVENE